MSTQSGQMALNWQSFDVRLPVKTAMARALRESRLSREQVAECMNALAAASGITFRVTVHVMDKWTAPSADHSIPYQLLPLFCRATESLLPLEALAAPLGVTIAGPREQKLIAYAEADLGAKRLTKAKRRALEDLL